MEQLFTTREDAATPPFIRCFTSEEVHTETLKYQCETWNYGVFEIDMAEVSSVSMLMSKFALAMKFPEYFGGNWDALIDMASDLSWNERSGYVAIIKHPEQLWDVEDQAAKKLIVVCKVVVKRWQSGEDEAGRPIPTTPFYWIFLSTPKFCTEIRLALS